MNDILNKIAEDLRVAPRQVRSAVELLDDGATVPFVARYRKEVTGGLDDSQLRRLEDRLGYLRELEERRELILRSIGEQGRLDRELEAQIKAADSKTRLEDLYHPYKPKRRTKAQIAREAGLEPLARSLLADPRQVPEVIARAFVDLAKGVPDAASALNGAQQILMESFAEDAELVGRLREHLWENGLLVSSVTEAGERDGGKFGDYFAYQEPLHKVPSHRALALFRGRNAGYLRLQIRLPEEDPAPGLGACEQMVAARFAIGSRGRAADSWLRESVSRAWRIKILTRLDLELKARLKERAEEEAIRVFAGNLADLLLAAPAGRQAIIGLDPGLRTGVKVAVVDATSKVVETATIYPHAPRKRWQESLAELAAIARRHNARLISIGNGTASRETDRLVAQLIKAHPELGLRKLVVNEAGASVYSASELGSQELPEMDVSLRGAVSIARRLQDPLAELVKIEPKAIGVGQYQHDVCQTRLARMLGNVVEDCVNAVGVDVNTASQALLTRVSGLSRKLADNLVRYRDEHGAFSDRVALKRVPRLGDKTFQQAAGFLRVPNGANPLDASAVHPEAYPVVQRILRSSGKTIKDVIGNRPFLRAIAAEDFTDARFGLPTVRDIIGELEKPGRDPRPEFKTAEFRDGVEGIGDLQPGMILEGVVSNVTNFGAFVDIGVHQDGLVHISAMADTFVKDPRAVVRAGDVVRVKVLQVDPDRRRIGLSMRLSESAPGPRTESGGRVVTSGKSGQSRARSARALADALEKATKS